MQGIKILPLGNRRGIEVEWSTAPHRIGYFNCICLNFFIVRFGALEIHSMVRDRAALIITSVTLNLLSQLIRGAAAFTWCKNSCNVYHCVKGLEIVATSVYGSSSCSQWGLRCQVRAQKWLLARGAFPPLTDLQENPGVQIATRHSAI